MKENKKKKTFAPSGMHDGSKNITMNPVIQ